MEDKQELFDELIQIKDSYEPDPELAKRVIQKINQREATVTFKEPVPKWFWVTLTCILVATLIIFLSFYLTLSDSKITVYSAESIVFEDITDLDNFISEKDLDFKYFKDKFAKNAIAKIKNTDTLAYVVQEFYDVGENGFDKVDLKIVLLQNAEFDFYNDFASLEHSFVIENVNIEYSVFGAITENKICAKCIIENKSYFLEILTNDDSTAVLEKYVNQLLN